jgi:1,4-dihydroxy-6-naphthoate synthase
MPHYTVAHSPDADDIFMYYAIKFGWITSKELSFENIALDIETLNVAALKGVYDVSAISFALYPFIKDEYALTKTAASFGEGYGPKLIKKKGVKLKRHFKVALSGVNTTNAMLFKMKYPDAKIVYLNFLEIEDAVLRGEVDAGVLIHESILTYSDLLETEAEIYDIWVDFIKDTLPLPLGGMGIRRSLPLNRAIEVEEMLTKAITVGLSHQSLFSKMLMQRDLIRVNEQELEKYLGLYANSESEVISAKGVQALDALFTLGYDKGVYSQKIETEAHFIPTIYQSLRES